MEHTLEHEEHSGGGTKEIIKVTVILSVLTLIELALGFWLMSITDHTYRLVVKGTITILMLAKAFYIVAYFMHLRNEIRNLIMTIVVPLLLFVWFITAFLYDGNSFKHLRNTYDPHYKEQSTIKIEKKEGEHKETEQKAESKETKPEEKKVVE